MQAVAMLIEAVLVAKKPKGQGAGGGDACEGGAGEGGAGEGGAGEGGAGAGGAGEGALQKVHARRSSAYGNGGHDAVVLVEAVATMAIPLARPSLGRFSCQVSSTPVHIWEIDRPPGEMVTTGGWSNGGLAFFLYLST